LQDVRNLLQATGPDPVGALLVFLDLLERQVERFARLAGAEFPPALAARFAAVADDPAEVRRIGVDIATALCQELLDRGVPGVHFYTLNRSTATREIYANLGLPRTA